MSGPTQLYRRIDLDGFEFWRDDPSEEGPVRTVLMNPTFVRPERGPRSDGDQYRRYKGNLTIIFEAVVYFSDFWGQRDRPAYWDDLKQTLRFRPGVSAHHIRDIVTRYIQGRTECLSNGGSRRTTRLAECADQINRLSGIRAYTSTWQTRDRFWYTRLNGVLANLGSPTRMDARGGLHDSDDNGRRRSRSRSRSPGRRHDLDRHRSPETRSDPDLPKRELTHSPGRQVRPAPNAQGTEFCIRGTAPAGNRASSPTQPLKSPRIAAGNGDGISIRGSASSPVEELRGPRFVDAPTAPKGTNFSILGAAAVAAQSAKPTRSAAVSQNNASASTNDGPADFDILPRENTTGRNTDPQQAGKDQTDEIGINKKRSRQDDANPEEPAKKRPELASTCNHHAPLTPAKTTIWPQPSDPETLGTRPSHTEAPAESSSVDQISDPTDLTSILEQLIASQPSADEAATMLQNSQEGPTQTCATGNAQDTTEGQTKKAPESATDGQSRAFRPIGARLVEIETKLEKHQVYMDEVQEDLTAHKDSFSKLSVEVESVNGNHLSLSVATNLRLAELDSEVSKNHHSLEALEQNFSLHERHLDKLSVDFQSATAKKDFNLVNERHKQDIAHLRDQIKFIKESHVSRKNLKDFEMKLLQLVKDRPGSDGHLESELREIRLLSNERFGQSKDLETKVTETRALSVDLAFQVHELRAQLSKQSQASSKEVDVKLGEMKQQFVPQNHLENQLQEIREQLSTQAGTNAQIAQLQADLLEAKSTIAQLQRAQSPQAKTDGDSTASTLLNCPATPPMLKEDPRKSVKHSTPKEFLQGCLEELARIHGSLHNKVIDMNNNKEDETLQVRIARVLWALKPVLAVAKENIQKL